MVLLTTSIGILPLIIIIIIQLIVMIFAFVARKHVNGSLRTVLNYLVIAGFMFFLNYFLTLLERAIGNGSLIIYERISVLIGLVMILILFKKMDDVLKHGG